MFIKKNTSRQRGKTYVNYLLVESVRTPKGPRQKVVCSLGDLRPRPAQEWLLLARKVEDALAAQQSLMVSDDDEVREIVEKVRLRQAQGDDAAAGETGASEPTRADDVVAVRTDGVETQDVREAGAVHVGREFWRRLGLDDILRDAGLSERAVKLACAMVMNRLITPRSENAMPDWIRTTALADLLGEDFDTLAEDSLYRNMDRLHPHREQIEAALARRERDLFNLDNTIFFYDLTSTYFEGRADGVEKAKRGYSRDKRPDCKQVVIGLAVNREGFPVAHEVFEGNARDHQTVGEMLDAIDRRLGLRKGQTVVVDRGMAYRDCLEEITSRGLHYLVAGLQSERNQWLEELEDTGGFEQVARTPSPQNQYQKKSRILVKKQPAQNGPGSIILCKSEGREQKDRAIRLKHEKRMRADLDALAARISSGRLKKEPAIHEAIGRIKERYPRVARYFTVHYDASAHELTHADNNEKKTIAENLDGSYILKTDRTDLDANEAWLIYTTLTRAEAAFRAMKSPLAERPIFHKIDRRVETHIFLCLLAYHLLVAIEKTLLDKNIHTSWATVRETLDTHKILTIVLPTDSGHTLRIRKSTKPEPQVTQLYNLLQIPQQIIEPQKTWHSNADTENVVTRKKPIPHQ
jgi:transposase